MSSESKEPKSEKQADQSSHHDHTKPGQAAEGPGAIIDREAKNRGKSGSDERHAGQSPPPRTDDQEETVAWQTTAQETDPDPHHGSAATAPQKPGLPAQPNTPPENSDADGDDKKAKDGK